VAIEDHLETDVNEDDPRSVVRIGNGLLCRDSKHEAIIIVRRSFGSRKGTIGRLYSLVQFRW
jgi:hypothetical protein